MFCNVVYCTGSLQQIQRNCLMTLYSATSSVLTVRRYSKQKQKPTEKKRNHANSAGLLTYENVIRHYLFIGFLHANSVALRKHYTLSINWLSSISG